MNQVLTQQQKEAIAAVEKIVTAGWRFEAWSYRDNCLKGWWTLPGSEDPVKTMRRGDPLPFHLGALYVRDYYLDSD